VVQRSEIEDRPNLLVLHVERLCSTLPGTIGDAISTRGQSGTTHGIHTDDAHSVGYQQFENVAFFAEHSTEFSKRVGIGQVTKLSVLPRLELFSQSEPVEISQSGDQTAMHEGEVFAGVQSVLLRSAHFGTNEIRAEQVQGDMRRAQFAQTLSISHPLGKFTISGEVWHFSPTIREGQPPRR
jgi:hypothetical protein